LFTSAPALISALSGPLAPTVTSSLSLDDNDAFSSSSSLPDDDDSDDDSTSSSDVVIMIMMFMRSDFGQTALTAFQAVKNVQKPLRLSSFFKKHMFNYSGASR
jgi:hypothetical protein